MAINSLHFDRRTYPDILEIVNKLAKLEKRKPHDSAKRLLLEAGTARIRKLSKLSRRKSSTRTTSLSDGDNSDKRQVGSSSIHGGAWQHRQN